MKIKQKDVNRLYFVVRSWIMGQIGGLIFLFVVWILGSIDFFQTIFLGAFIFILSLVISRLFESEINKGIKITLKFLDKHPKLKKFTLKYF